LLQSQAAAPAAQLQRWVVMLQQSTALATVDAKALQSLRQAAMLTWGWGALLELG
jgi:hypothetical protein